MPNLHRRCAAALLLQGLLPLSFGVRAREAAPAYPDRPVRLLVPFGPGNPADLRARQIAQRLSQAWGQPMVVENRPGAGGQLAMELLARAARDGYTLAMAGQSALAIAPHLRRLPFDPLADFAPVTRTGHAPVVLVVNASIGARSLPEFVDAARKTPGRMNASSWGSGSITHLALELFMRAANVQLAHIPYKDGAGQAIADLVGGRVQVAFDFVPQVVAHVRSGRLHALGVAGRERLAALPDVPTFTEQRLAQMEPVGGWQGIAAPAGTPAEIIRKLHADIAQALADPVLRASYIDSGTEPGGNSPEEFGAFIRAEHVRWGKLIAEAGIRED